MKYFLLILFICLTFLTKSQDRRQEFGMVLGHGTSTYGVPGLVASVEYELGFKPEWLSGVTRFTGTIMNKNHEKVTDYTETNNGATIDLALEGRLKVLVNTYLTLGFGPSFRAYETDYISIVVSRGKTVLDYVSSEQNGFTLGLNGSFELTHEIANRYVFGVRLNANSYSSNVTNYSGLSLSVKKRIN